MIVDTTRPLPASCPIDERRIHLTLVKCNEAAQNDQHRERQVTPDLRQDHDDHRQHGATQPGGAVDSEEREHPVRKAVVGVEEHAEEDRCPDARQQPRHYR